MTVAALALSLLGAYLIGAIPFALVFSWLFGLADPRSFGSGNPGATNVLRSGSKPAAALTLVFDAAKGAAAVALCRLLAEHWSLPPSWPAWAGAAAFAGHLFPVYLQFRGGKGVAVFLGVLLALDPLVGVATCLLWLLIALWLRYSSAASIVSALAASLALMRAAAGPGVLPAVVLMALFLLWRHHRNIANLLRGKEPRIGAPATPAAP